MKKPQDLIEALQQCKEGFESLIEYSSNWYWEQDEAYRFTVVTGSNLNLTGIDPKQVLGTARWDRGAVPVGDDGSWDKHKAKPQDSPKLITPAFSSQRKYRPHSQFSVSHTARIAASSAPSALSASVRERFTVCSNLSSSSARLLSVMSLAMPR